MSKRRRHSSWRWQAVTSSISITMVLILLGLVVFFSLTAHRMSREVREDLTMTIVLQDDVTEEEAHELESELATQRYISDIQYISAEDALKEQTELMGTDPTDFLGANPFSISMDLKMKAEYACMDSLLLISQRLKGNKMINEVIYQQELVESINKNLGRVSVFLLVVAALLILISMSLINNTVRLSVYSRRFIINTMKLVGAQWSFIRKPFMKRSFWIGLYSALLAIGVLIGGLQWAGGRDEVVKQYVTPSVMCIIALVVLAFGLLISMTCTYLSVTHYLKTHENKLY